MLQTGANEVTSLPVFEHAFVVGQAPQQKLRAATIHFAIDQGGNRFAIAVRRGCRFGVGSIVH
ncbi:MAG: hypothetical protein R6V61_06690 [Wenzhouxiangellaceae bacterium]